MAPNPTDDNTGAGMRQAQEDSMYQQMEEEPQEEIQRQEEQPMSPVSPREPESVKTVLPHDHVMLHPEVPTAPLQDNRICERSHDLQPANVASELLQRPDDSREDTNHGTQTGSEERTADEDHTMESPDDTSTPPPLPAQSTSTSQSTHDGAFPSSSPTTPSDSSTQPWAPTHVRVTPHHPSSLLRPGSRFSGTQQSDRQIYKVDVTILTLSTAESSLTGYLRIEGLTEDHPTLTTFFTGEVIGGPTPHYTFSTKHPSWGATDKTDLQHWARFPAWRPLARDAKRDIDFAHPWGSGPEPDPWWQRPHVFMRWKEWFLVPDHLVTSIQGASFEGFYYICFNQVEGRISGIYFHAKSEK